MMHRGFCYRVFLCALSALALAVPVFPQAAGSTAELRGKVTDQSGGVLPGVTIMLSDEAKGTTRSAITDERGAFAIPLLPPAVYEAKAAFPGFGTQIRKGVRLTVGQIATLDFLLQVSGRTEEIVVTGEAQLIETTRTQQSNTIEEKRIRELPINRRDYLSYSLLAPGVTDSKAIADNSDFRVTQTPNSGLSFYGSNGRGNNVTIDGLDNNFDSGGVRPTLSQEGVQEFQINRSNYSAEFGGASGGVINIVSKSGANEFHGNVFGFFRNEQLDARNPFAFQNVGDQVGVPVKPVLSRQQYGVTLGGPIRRDKTFFFGAFEQLNENRGATVPLLLNFDPFGPDATQRQILNVLSGIPGTGQIVGVLTGLWTTCVAPCRVGFAGDANKTRTINLFKTNSGVAPVRDHNTTTSLRLDHNFSPSDQLFSRFNYTKQFGRNTAVGALLGFSRGSESITKDWTFVVSENHIFSPNMYNEFRTKFSYTSAYFIPAEPNGPALDINGFGFFGKNIFLPAFNIERNLQWIDNFSLIRGNHTFKMGADISFYPHYHADNQTFFGGRFNFGPLPAGALLPPALIGPALAALNGAGRADLAGFLQGPSSVNALQAFNAGVPQFYQQGFGTTVYTSNIHRYGFYFQDSWKVSPTFMINMGLRYELDQEPGGLLLDQTAIRQTPIPQPQLRDFPRDKKNFAPRVGFSWDPKGDGKTVLRGGYGIYYAPIPFQIPDVVATLNGVVIRQVFTSLAVGTLPITIFQGLRGNGVLGSRRITEADISAFGLTPRPDPNNPFAVLFPIESRYQRPYTQQISFGIERELFRNLSISADYIFVRGAKITRARDNNLVPTGGTLANGARAFTFNKPLTLQSNVFESSANSFYHGFTLSANKRYSRHFLLTGNYTFSKAMDEVTDYNSDFEAHDQLNLRAERALSAFHQRHRIVMAGVLESPFKAGPGNHVVSRIFADTNLSPILTVISSRPFNLLAGTDTSGDRHSTTHRPPFAGRNTGIGPHFISFDMRVAKRWRINGDSRRSLETTFEAFNIFNHLNFASVNNIVGNVSMPTYRVKGRSDLNPTERLAFTSAHNPRQLQLGFRFSF
ncbi:MAG: TonB-dependent receptor [Acidobacteria bacterium]|nr:TonB-dependent receptor [Acidobacteriota bacterium]MBI3657418.1 TonB-dependent receptor [Acidobacteriota bacterium]